MTVYVYFILFTFYNVGEKRKLWTGVRAAELLRRFTSCFQVDAKAPNVVTSRRCLGENGTEFLESAACLFFVTEQVKLFCYRDDGNVNDNATDQWFDWLNEEK